MLPKSVLGEEMVMVQEEAKPPEPTKPPPPAPPPPPEKPQEETPPPPSDPNPPPQAAPTPPQLGLPDGSLSDNGPFKVATGVINGQRKPIVMEPSAVPALPPAPVAITRPPDELSPVKPEYPEWAQDQGVTAVVVAQVTIDANGSVVDVRIVRSGGKDFDRSARAALAAARYRPYIKDGKAVPAVFERRFDFQLE